MMLALSRRVKGLALLFAMSLCGASAWALDVYYGETYYDFDKPGAYYTETFYDPDWERLNEEPYYIYLEISANMTGSFDFPGLKPGDLIEMRLSNLSVYPLVFQTANQLGEENQWLVPAKDMKTVRFLFNPSRGNQVRYVVLNPYASQVTEDVIAMLNLAEAGDVYFEEIDLHVGEGSFTLWDLEKWDKLMLSLYNPTQWYVLFEFTDPNIQKPVLIPPLSSRLITHEYVTDPAFGNKVKYKVTLQTLVLD